MKGLCEQEGSDRADNAPIAGSFPLIWATIAKIPPGHTASYGEIATRSGLPRLARLVAQALRAAPDALGLPWFRVIRANGTLAFTPGSAAFKRQKALLEREGARVQANGRVIVVDDGPRDDLDALLWRP